LIRELENQFNAAWDRRDPEGLAESLADDATDVRPGRRH
jgi:Domain of unknown function (DUF4440)